MPVTHMATSSARMDPCFLGPMPASSGFICSTISATILTWNGSASICSRVHTLLPSSKTPNLGDPPSRPPSATKHMRGGLYFVHDNDELDKHGSGITKFGIP